LGQGWVQVRSLAHVPEQITGTWAVWNSTDKVWMDAPDLRIAAADTQARVAAERVANEPLPKALPSAASSGEEALMVGEDVSPQATIVSACSHNTDRRFDVFLTHDWGTDSEGRRTHERVAQINKYLKSRGLSTCFDEDRMAGNVIDKMCAGIDDSDLIAVFVTQNYIDKVGGKHGPHDNCKKEFEYAERTKGADRLLSVVMESAVRDTRKWRGGVGMVLGSRSSVDLACEQDSEQGSQALQTLYEAIMKVRGIEAASSDASMPVPSLPPQATSAASSSSSTEQQLTMVQKVEMIKEQLGLDSKLNIAKGVAEANASMGIEGVGQLHTQVERLMAELGINDVTARSSVGGS